MHILSYLKIIFEIAVLWYFIYMALCFVKGTRTEQLLKGLVIIGIIFIITQQLKLEAISWVLARLFPISIIALLIIFQPELRQGLARIGQFGVYREHLEAMEEIASAVAELSNKRIGALIAIEREVGLKTYVESGVAIDSKVSEQLLVTMFMPKTPLHDGAVIIRKDRIVAAGCLLPLTQEDKGLSMYLGTRHRAAIGLSEETDAVCVVVSEETRAISIAMGGKLIGNVDKKNLANMLKDIFYKNNKARSRAKA